MFTLLGSALPRSNYRGETQLSQDLVTPMGITSNWLRIVEITDDWIELATGTLGATTIQPRSALIHGAAADEQRRLRPDVQQAEMYGPFYDWIGELLCKA